MDKYLILERDLLDGKQWIYRFKNNYGASVVEHQYSRGKELVVTKFYGPDAFDWNLYYTAKIIKWNLHYLDEKHLKKLLRKIQKLK